jgi:gliding motility-associated-like protein
LHLIVAPAVTGEETITVCAGQLPYTWNGQSLTAAGDYTATLTNTAGCDSIATLHLIVNPQPILLITNPAAICATGTIDLTAAAITNGSTNGLTYTYWANAAGTVALANASNVAIGGTYYIKGTTAEGCSIIQPVTVSFFPVPTAILSGSGIICEGSSRTLTVNLSGTAPFQLVYTDGTTSTTVNSISTNSYQFTVTPQANTTYTITSITDANCSNTASGSSATITIDPATRGIRYTDVVAVANVPRTLTARILGNDYSYNWTPATGLSDPSINNPVFLYDRQTEYWIEMTSANGCTTVDTLLVKMLVEGPLDNESDIFVPKAWSPNNDGHNDKLFPIPVKIKELKYFRIFNRWGQLVFETNILRNGWDGIFHGQPQVMDTYTWTLEAIGEDGKYFKRAGNSVLVR